MSGIYFLFQCLLSFLLLYSSFVSVYIAFFKNRHFDFLSLFFSLTLVVLFAFSLKEIFLGLNFSPNLKFAGFLSILKKIAGALWMEEKESKKPASPAIQISQGLGEKSGLLKADKTWLALIFISLISLMAGFFNVWTQFPRGFFFDEIAQFSSSGARNLTDLAARQEQPPLDYYFSSFSQSLFGIGKFAARFHALLFYLILSFILPLGLRFFFSSLWAVGLGSALFLINHVVRLHAVYARPYGLALLTGFLFLFFYLSYFRKKPDEKLSLLSVLASQNLFALSVGLQPVIFIVSLFISSFWLLPQKRLVFRNLFFSHIGTAVLALPFYLSMWGFGQSNQVFKELSYKFFVSYFSEWNISYFIETYFFSFYKQMSWLFLALIIAFLTVSIVKRRAPALALAVLGSTALFPLIYDFVFQAFIFFPWFPRRFFITLSLLLIFSFVLALNEINIFLKKWKAAFFFPLAALALGSLGSQALAIKNETRFDFPYRDNSVENIYAYLKERGKPGDMAVYFNLFSIIDNYNRDFIFSSKIYSGGNFKVIWPKRIIHSSPLDFDLFYHIDRKNFIEDKNQKLFLISNSEETKETARLLSDFLNGKRFGDYTVFALDLKERGKQGEYISFLAKLIPKTSKELQAALYETLLYYMYENGAKDRFYKLLGEYKSLEPFLDRETKDYKLSIPVEFRRRVRYFESLEWARGEK